MVGGLSLLDGAKLAVLHAGFLRRGGDPAVYACSAGGGTSSGYPLFSIQRPNCSSASGSVSFNHPTNSETACSWREEPSGATCSFIQFLPWAYAVLRV